MKYISQTMDFISYKDGAPGVSVTSVFTRYCISDSQTNAPTNDDNGWNDDFDSILKTYYSNKATNPGTTYYIWSQEVVTYDSGPNSYATTTVNSANSVIANWCTENDVTKINGAHIATGTVTAVQLSADAVKSNNYTYVDEDGKTIAPTVENEDDVPYSKNGGTFLNLADGSIYSPHFVIDDNGDAYFDGTLGANAVSAIEISADMIEVCDLNAFGATIGGWEIAEDMLRKDSTALVANNKATYQSLINSNSKSPVRLTIGGTFVSEVIEASIETEDDGMIDHDILYTVGASTELLSYTMLECRDADNNVLNNEDFMLSVDDNEILVYRAGSSEYVQSVITFKLRVEYNRGGSPFKVLEDGSLYASASEMKGNINASGGTIGGWSIEEDGLHADNNTVGIIGDETDSVRFYAGLEKYLPKGGYVQLNKADLTATTLDDGWTRYSGLMFDEKGEPIGCVNYPLQLIEGSQLDIFDVVAAEVRCQGLDLNITEVYSVQIRNAYAEYNSTANKIAVETFECNNVLHDDSYIIFDLHYYADDMANANFRVLNNGHIYGDRLSANNVDANALTSESIVSSELACKSIDIDGAVLQRKGGEIIGEAYTEEFNFKIEIANRYFLLYEVDDKNAPATYKFDVQYKLNGKTATMQVAMPSGSSFESIFVSSKNGDKLTDVVFVDTNSNVITVQETTGETYADKYVESSDMLSVPSLKIGNYKLTPDDLAALLDLLNKEGE